MTDAIDKLLSELETSEFKTRSAQSPQVPSPPLQSSSPASEPQAIEDLLAEIGGSSSSRSPQTPSSSPQAVPRSTLSPATHANAAAIDPLLADLKDQYQHRDREEAIQREQQRQAEQRRQEQIQLQQRAARIKRAEAWLKALDPKSGDAAWFEAFAANYPSRLDAAIDYIATLGETGQERS